jgi:hypothetical protein
MEADWNEGIGLIQENCIEWKCEEMEGGTRDMAQKEARSTDEEDGRGDGKEDILLQGS